VASTLCVYLALDNFSPTVQTIFLLFLERRASYSEIFQLIPSIYPPFIFSGHLKFKHLFGSSFHTSSSDIFFLSLFRSEPFSFSSYDASRFSRPTYVNDKTEICSLIFLTLCRFFLLLLHKTKFHQN
jgi:hypothetical protein